VNSITEPARIRRFIDSNSTSAAKGIAAVTEGNEYHRKAMRCVRAAERLHDPGERAKLLEIARAYLGLARHVAERHDYATAQPAAEYDARRPENT
jgi:hypothetical protein